MKRISFSLMVGFFCLISGIASAEGLPANPWAAKAPSPNSGIFPNADTPADGTKAPAYDNKDIMPVDPWAKARDTSGIRTWRGSGQHGKLNYVGEATTMDENANGQELLAPEVNRHNMVVMLDHLRKLGYKIPESYNQNISDIPMQYKAAWVRNYKAVHTSSNPFSRSLVGMMNSFENMTGLDVHNLITNTIDLLGTD